MKNIIPIQQYICRPIIFKGKFVYRIHLPITPPRDFFDSLNHGYYIRNIQKTFQPKESYNPFTFSMINEDAYIYITSEEKIIEKINDKTYSYVARDFIVDAENIKDFVDHMKVLGYEPRDFIQSQGDVHHQLMLLEKKVLMLKDEYRDHDLKEKYIYEIFNCIDKNQLKKIEGKAYNEFSSIRNVFAGLWDEAFELKNIYQKFHPIKGSKDIEQEKISTLYNNINKQALEEISLKNKGFNYLIDIMKWRNKFMEHVSDFNPVKSWFLAATGPLHVFASQLQIKDITGFNKLNEYHQKLVFIEDKYGLALDQDGIYTRLIKNKDYQTHQEEIKLLLEEYKNTGDAYTKRKIEMKIEHFKFILRMIKDIRTFL